jgi:hypothetical protein
MSIKLPESIVQELKARQQTMGQLQHELQLILRTFMATIEGDKVYQLSDDLTELIEVINEEVKEDGESVPIEVSA